MTIDRFIEIIPKIKELIIDSNVSQLKMAPPFRKDLLELTRNNYKNSKNAGVTVLFHPCNNRVSFTLILRNEYDGVHSNQISLPGGSFEKNDKNIFGTALRETNEEIGIDINEVQLIRKLQNVYVPPSNYDISPFMVYTENELKFVKDINEVKEIINVDLEQLFIDSNIVKTKGSQISNRYLNTLVPAYKLNGYFVWGATAMILSEVKDIIKSVL
ncbi:MAG TPA: CoA pyrophosphatase [Cytophagales bacterium]|nr:CoA pyrophosphatase [Cytophagales bacterium]